MALVLTDFPYGIGEAYDQHDDTQDGLRELVAECVPALRGMAPVLLVTTGTRNLYSYPQPEWTLAWFVPAGTGAGPWGFTCWQPILAYGKDPFLAKGQGSRPDAFVLTESADNSLGHPCAKPLKVWEWIMQRGSIDRGDVVFDPFLGSGTTMIAAENLGRRSIGVEISPNYVAVALQRFLDAFGVKAVRL